MNIQVEAAIQVGMALLALSAIVPTLIADQLFQPELVDAEEEEAERRDDFADDGGDRHRQRGSSSSAAQSMFARMRSNGTGR